MIKKKIELILNIVITLLAVSLAVVYGIDGQWLHSVLFAIIGLVNIVGVILRLKQ